MATNRKSATVQSATIQANDTNIKNLLNAGMRSIQEELHTTLTDKLAELARIADRATSVNNALHNKISQVIDDMNDLLVKYQNALVDQHNLEKNYNDTAYRLEIAIMALDGDIRAEEANLELLVNTSYGKDQELGHLGLTNKEAREAYIKTRLSEGDFYSRSRKLKAMKLWLELINKGQGDSMVIDQDYRLHTDLQNQKNITKYVKTALDSKQLELQALLATV